MILNQSIDPSIGTLNNCFSPPSGRSYHNSSRQYLGIKRAYATIIVAAQLDDESYRAPICSYRLYKMSLWTKLIFLISVSSHWRQPSPLVARSSVYNGRSTLDSASGP